MPKAPEGNLRSLLHFRGRAWATAKLVAVRQHGASAELLSVNVDQREPFLPHRLGKVLVQRNHLKRCGTPFGRNERRGKLQCIGRPQLMYAQEPDRIFADKLARFDLVPGVGDQPQSLEGNLGTLGVEERIAFETCQGGSAFHGRTPPRQHVGIALRERLHALCRRLGHQQWNDCRGVPELHPLSRRSLVSASTPEAPE
jgi:hypothetical protein